MASLTFVVSLGYTCTMTIRSRSAVRAPREEEDADAPVPARSSSTPVRVPDDLLDEVDAVSALSAKTVIHMTRAEVVEAAVRAGLPSVREQFEARTR